MRILAGIISRLEITHLPSELIYKNVKQKIIKYVARIFVDDALFNYTHNGPHFIYAWWTIFYTIL